MPHVAKWVDQRMTTTPLQQVVADFFVRRVGTERAARTATLIDAWRSDLVLRDEVDVGVGVAAEAAAVPCAGVVVIAAGGLLDATRLQAPLTELRTRHGSTRWPFPDQRARRTDPRSGAAWAA
jgi:hypothetical protein